MIRNKKEIEEKLIERLTQKASQEIFKETTEELINSINEEREIEKKRKVKQKLTKHKKRKINIITLGGTLEINRTVLYNRQMKKTVIPKDEYLRIANLPFKITKAMMVEFAFYAQNQISFEETKYMLEKTYDINTNAETIRKVAEYVGKQVFEKDTKEAEVKYERMDKLPMLKETEKEDETLYILTDGAALNTRIEDENRFYLERKQISSSIYFEKYDKTTRW